MRAESLLVAAAAAGSPVGLGSDLPPDPAVLWGAIHLARNRDQAPESSVER